MKEWFAGHLTEAGKNVLRELTRSYPYQTHIQSEALRLDYATSNEEERYYESPEGVTICFFARTGGAAGFSPGLRLPKGTLVVLLMDERVVARVDKDGRLWLTGSEAPASLVAKANGSTSFSEAARDRLGIPR